MFHHRKHSKDSTTSPLAHTTSHSSSKSHEPYKIGTITTVSELEQIFEDHHHKHIIVFCLLSNHNEPHPHTEGDFDEEAWYGIYANLNNVHFVKVEIDGNEELEERLRPRTKPCWITFHKGSETGGSSGGMKRFVQVHSGRKNSS